MRDALSGLTTRGRCFVASGLALIGASAASGEPDLLRVGLLALALPLLSATVVARTRYRLSSDRRLGSPRTAAGQDSTVTLRLENLSRLPTGLLLVEDRVPYVLGSRPRFVLDRVEPRGRREVAYTVRSDVRGRYQIGPISIRLTDPFGLCELQRSFTHRDILVVTPVAHPLPPVTLSGEWAGSGESRARSVAAAGEDDAGTREYRQGDDLRRVHWRTTARQGQLMVRREEQPWQARASLLLDTRAGAHAGEGPGSSLEWAVSAAASIGAHLLRHGYFVRLLTDTGVSLEGGNLSLDGGSGDSEGALLDALAVVSPSDRVTLTDAVTGLRRGGGDGLLVAVLGALDLEEARQLTRMRHGTTVAVAVLLDTSSWAPQPLGRGPRFDDTVAMLRTGGWRVLAARAEDTIPRVWEHAARQPDLELLR